jgi:hypothetical protein
MCLLKNTVHSIRQHDEMGLFQLRMGFSLKSTHIFCCKCKRLLRDQLTQAVQLAPSPGDRIVTAAATSPRCTAAIEGQLDWDTEEGILPHSCMTRRAHARKVPRAQRAVADRVIEAAESRR